MPPQQERARRTRAAIVAAAAAEFSEHGYAAASLSAILKRSRATKGAMYFHFDSKEDLARAVLDEAVAHVVEQSRPVRESGGDALETLCGVLDVAAKCFQDELLRAEFRLALEPQLLERVDVVPSRVWGATITELFERAAAEGLLREGASPRALVRSLVAMIVGHRYVADLNAEYGDLRERLLASLEMLLQAHATESWLAGQGRTRPPLLL